MALIISEPQTRKLVDMAQAVALLDKMFRDRAAGKMRSVPRRRLKGSEKQLNMMAAWHQDSDLICLRSYAADANTITLYHGRKGGIQAIVNMGFLSSLRTPKRRKDFIKQMSKVVKADWKEADTVDEVEAASDILVVSTDSTTPVATGGSLKDEVLVASIGANSTVKHEVSNNLIRRMDLIVVDDLAAAKADSGDLVEACQTRIARWEDIMPLDKFVAQGMPQPRPKRIFFQSNGIADEDLAVGKYALDQAKRKKLKLRSVTEI